MLRKVLGDLVPCRVCGEVDDDGHLFLGLHLPPTRTNP